MDVTSPDRTKSTRPDFQSVDASAWMERPFPDTANRPPHNVAIVIKQSVLNAIHRHGHERTDVEICGVLVGNGFRDREGAFVHVVGSIQGNHAASQLAQVTFTAETWNHIHCELDQSWPKERILAWYHTHPGFGIFLSPMDLFIHESFFNADEQFALVYDPLSADEGVFVWTQGNTERAAIAIEPDEAAWMPPENATRANAGDLARSAEPNAITAPATNNETSLRAPKWRRTAIWLAVSVGLFSIAITEMNYGVLARYLEIPKFMKANSDQDQHKVDRYEESSIGDKKPMENHQSTDRRTDRGSKYMVDDEHRERNTDDVDLVPSVDRDAISP